MTSSYSIDPVARMVATVLLEAGCVSVRTDEPFRLPSGWASPVYMDCRRLISFPQYRRQLVSQGLQRLQEKGALEGVVSVAGGEASGIAFAAWMADELGLPLQYVRKKQAGQSQIEGVLAPGSRVLLVDDMMAGGHSKLRFCKALGAAGATVENLFVIFDYGTFPTQQLLAPLGVTVHALATWRDVLTVAREQKSFGARTLDELEDFLNDPPKWSHARGGISANKPSAKN